MGSDGAKDKGSSSPSVFPGDALIQIELLLDRHHDRLARQVEEVVSLHLTELARVRPCASPVFTPLLESPIEEQSSDCSDSVMSNPFVDNKFSKRARPATSFGASQVEKKASAHALKAERFLEKVSPRTALKLEREKTAWQWRKFASSNLFECMSCCLIIINSIFFGIEAQYLSTTGTSPEYGDELEIGGHIFTCIFTFELIFRMSANLKDFFTSQQWLWNFLDMVIVLASLAEMMMSFSGTAGQGSAAANLTYVRIIRVARTVRVFRVVKLLKVFTSLRILIVSVLNTLKSLVWTMVLLAIILYIFGLLFTSASSEFLKSGSPPDDTVVALRTYYGSLFISVYTLFQAITNGVSWSEISWPLGAIHPMWEGVFVIFITFVYFAVLNVVTGVFCQSAIESANQDRDTVVQAQLSMAKVYSEQLERLFHQIDNEDTGMITLSMFEESLQDEHVRAYFDGLDLTTDDAWNLFKLLDKNESQAIDLEEFVSGCLRLRGRARSVDIHMLLYQHTWTMKRLGEVVEKLNSFNEGWAPTGFRVDSCSSLQAISYLPSLGTVEAGGDVLQESNCRKPPHKKKCRL